MLPAEGRRHNEAGSDARRSLIPDGFLLVAFTFSLALGLMTAGFAFSLLAG